MMVGEGTWGLDFSKAASGESTGISFRGRRTKRNINPVKDFETSTVSYCDIIFTNESD